MYVFWNVYEQVQRNIRTTVRRLLINAFNVGKHTCLQETQSFLKIYSWFHDQFQIIVLCVLQSCKQLNTVYLIIIVIIIVRIKNYKSEATES